MSAFNPPRLHLLPGHPHALFIVCLEGAVSVFAVRNTRLLEGLRLAGRLLSFSELQREETPLDELLPWAGNV